MAHVACEFSLQWVVKCDVHMMIVVFTSYVRKLWPRCACGPMQARSLKFRMYQMAREGKT